MGSAQATEFLAGWITRNIGPSGYDNERCAEGLSLRCFEEAGAAGILGADLTEAAHGELEGYLLDQLNDAADAAQFDVLTLRCLSNRGARRWFS